MGVLSDTFEKTKGIEDKFPHKRVLFIGSESYDGGTITVIEGLHELGFEILTFGKGNINSWFCNTIIDDLDGIEDRIDFVLSNLHWGTRWSLYEKLSHAKPYILIDGDDRRPESPVSDWKVKWQVYLKIYNRNVSETLKNLPLSPCRWIEDMPSCYTPDVVFMSQKFKVNTDTIFLPFGINSSYFIEDTAAQSQTTHDRLTSPDGARSTLNVNDRQYDICHIPGPGAYRAKMQSIVQTSFAGRKVWNKKAYGPMIVFDERIEENCKSDKNVHSWHRWRVCQDYLHVLLDSKICMISLINTYNSPGWESKRPYEALAFGCYVMFQKQPDFDNASYPLEEIDEDLDVRSASLKSLGVKDTGGDVLFPFEDYAEMTRRCNYLLDHPKVLEKKRVKCYENALKYFTPAPIARYFLWNVLNLTK